MQFSYSAVWRPGTRAQWWKFGLDWDEFKKKDKKMFDDGFRLVNMFATPRSDQCWGAWRPGTRTQRWRVDLSDAESKEQDLAFFNHGLRLRRISIGGPGFSGIWQPGTGTRWVRHHLSWDAFKQTDLDFFNQGLRVHDFHAHFASD